MGLITIVWPFPLSEEAKHAARTSAGFIEALVGRCAESSTHCKDSVRRATPIARSSYSIKPEEEIVVRVCAFGAGYPCLMCEVLQGRCRTVWGPLIPTLLCTSDNCF